MNVIPQFPLEIWAKICTYVDDESLVSLGETNSEIREVAILETTKRQKYISEKFYNFLSYQILSILPAVSNIVFLTDHDECVVNSRNFIKLEENVVSLVKTMKITSQFIYLRGAWMSCINNDEIEQWNARLTKFQQTLGKVEKNIEILNVLKKIHDAIINIFEASKPRDLNEDEIKELNLIEGRLKRIAEHVNSPTVISFSGDCTFSIQIDKLVDLVYQIPKERIYICPLADLIKDNSSLLSNKCST